MKNNQNTFVALLRGINIGGKHTVKMESLRQVFAEMGFDDVKTYIQSDNVIFRAPESDEPKLQEKIAKRLRECFAFEIELLILTVDDLARIINHSPENFGAEPDQFRYDVWFLTPSITADDIVPSLGPRAGVDLLWIGENVIYTSRLTTQMGKSGFSSVMRTPRAKDFIIRNWRTTAKLFELVG